MFVCVEFGHKQRRLFNIDCQTSSLLDAINDSWYEDINQFLTKQTGIFEKELAQWKKKETNLQKKLKTDEEKQEEQPIQKKNTTKRGGRTNVKVRTTPGHPSKRQGTKKGKRKKPTEEELKKKEEEEALKKQEEEEAEAKRIEEEQKKKEEAEKAAKGKKKDKNAPEEEEEKELTEEEKKEKEREQIQKNLDEVLETISKLEAKLEKIKSEQDLLQEEAKGEKVLELQDINGERKYAKTKSDQYSTEFLSEKMVYILGKVIKNEQEEEEFQEIKIDGAWVRTLEEDANFDPEAEAADTKKGKGKKK